MGIEEIIEFVEGFEGVLALKPGPGDGTPEIAWGDAFFYYSPDGTVPTTTQPFATIVTKDYPDDQASRLDRPGAFRVNIAAGRDAFAAWTGRAPREPETGDTDPSAADAVIAHPVYGALGWLAVVNPGPRTDAAVRELLGTAHGLARERYRRREES
ncbi:DUF6194 family protein [Actinomadura sp. LOL_016]|uniref:DUF6194 family protein n=1 Tax=unclassified Actinomadura TaxID=2626254 RepID=UPI003A7F9CF4